MPDTMIQPFTEKEKKDTIESFKEVRFRAMVDDPFYATLAVRLDLLIVPPEEVNDIPIAATDSFYLYLNPRGWLPLDFSDKLFVMKHEILHCILRHPTRVRDRHPYLWNIAADFVVNGIIQEGGRKVPSWVIQPKPEFKGLDADTVYHMLAQKAPQVLLRSPAGDGGEGASGGRDGEKGGDAKFPSIPGTSRRMAKEYADHFDACPHGYMQPMKKDAEGNELSSKEIEDRTQQCEQEWRAATKQAMEIAKARGSAPSGIAELIEREQKPLLPWERLLNQWVVARTRGGYDWSRPSRRFVSQGIYVPGRLKRTLKGVAIAVDTSGSVSSKLLGKFLGEIAGILGVYPCNLDLVGIDAQVGYIGRYKNSYDFPDKVPVTGRGGTSFIPFFDWMEEVYGPGGELGEQPEVAIYLTDGMGAYPEQPPEGVNVLWVISMNHGKDSGWYPPFGDVIVAFDDPTDAMDF